MRPNKGQDPVNKGVIKTRWHGWENYTKRTLASFLHAEIESASWNMAFLGKLNLTGPKILLITMLQALVP